MREKSIFVAAAVGAMVATSGAAFGQSLGSDTFSYTGALTANNWLAHSGAGNKVVMANGSFATLEQSGGSGEDVNLKFFGGARSATDVTYAGFDIRIPTSDLSLLDANGNYMAHFKDSSFGFRARTGVVVPSGGGDWGLAINANSSALGAGATWPSDLSFDTWYRVVISYDASTGAAKLWLNAALESDPSIMDPTGSIGTLVETFAFRQSNDYTGFQNVDNLKMGMTFADVVVPTPGTLALLSTGGLLALRRRRH